MKEIPLKVGQGETTIQVPDDAVVLKAEKAVVLDEPARAIAAALQEPTATPSLAALARGRRDAAIVVSDNTRPVPYAGDDGILGPILDTLQGNGVETIRIIVATGTHRPMLKDELRVMLGEAAFRQGVEIINHQATDGDMLRYVGKTKRTPEVTLNRYYLDAELKILTGLVEPHFMAGFSGGRKAICPGIAGQSVTSGFHSAEILADPHSDSMVLENNPCHEEALQIAQMAGADFVVNVTVDAGKQLTGVFAGEMEAAHLAAVKHLCGYATVVCDREYDVTIIPGGEVGVNHYQLAKAAVEAARVTRRGGKIIVPAELTDPDPIGSGHYRKLLGMLQEMGTAKFLETILSADWTFAYEQWQVQMWAKVFAKVGGPARVYTCAVRLGEFPERTIPEHNPAWIIRRQGSRSEASSLKALIEFALREACKDMTGPDVLVLPDGPYTIPMSSDHRKSIERL